MTTRRVNEIDLLRFVAALAVVFFHFAFRGYAADGMSTMPYPMLASVSRYGYLGVPLFFMISGFVILMTAADSGLRGFVVSRIVRLYPAFWACCTLTFVVTLLIGAPRYTASFGQYLVNLTLLSEFFGVASIDGVYWSLFVELRFYALVAIVVLLGRMHQAEGLLLLWLAVSIAIELRPQALLGYVFITDYSAFFIAGATCFLVWSKGVSPMRIGMLVAAWALALAQSIDGLRSFETLYGTPLSRPVVACVITAFFAVMLLVSMRRTGSFGQRPWLLLGALTYPLYLVHQNIGYMVFNRAYPEVNPHVLLWGMLFAALACSYAVHVLIEKPLAPVIKSVLNHAIDTAQRLPRHVREPGTEPRRVPARRRPGAVVGADGLLRALLLALGRRH